MSKLLKAKPSLHNYLQALASIEGRWLKGEFTGLFCLWGSAPYMLRRGVRKLKADWRRLTGCEPQSYEPKELQNQEQFAAIWGWQGMFEAHSFYVVSQAQELKELGKKLQAIPSPQSLRHSLCLSFDGPSLLSGVSKELERLEAVMVPCPSLSGAEVRQLLGQLQKEEGLELTSEAQSLLLELCGDDFFKLENEIRKLALIFAPAEGSASRLSPLSPQEIAPFLGVIREDHAFALTSCLLNRLFEKAHLLMLDLLRRGETPLAVLGVLSRHTRTALRVGEARNQQLPLSEMARKIHLPYSVLNQYAQYVARCSLANLKDALLLCQAADMTLKSTPKCASELVLAEIILALRGSS